MTSLKLIDYDFDLPKELVAQEPKISRDNSRLLILNKQTGSISHKNFSDIYDYLNSGDCLVINKTKVIPARMFGNKETGGRIEALFLTFEAKDNTVKILLKPGLPSGKIIIFPEGLRAKVLRKTEIGETLAEITGPSVLSVLKKHGKMPLPPYIKRGRENDSFLSFDKERYQTVYAEKDGSIAAPTAGLHFTEKLISKLQNKGVNIARIILHVGWGTFRPITSDLVAEHKMLPENFEIEEKEAEKINRAKSNSKRVIAVGTTTVRALESCSKDKDGGFVVPSKNSSSIFIYPGYNFKFIDAFVTNFHLPKSTPLLMTCAFAGKDNVLKAYEEAVDNGYRFFSYGDAMFIV